MERLDVLADVCGEAEVDSMDLLDLALCRATTEELLIVYNQECGAFDYRPLLEGAGVSKVLSSLCKQYGISPAVQLGSLLIILKAMAVNRLGGCGKHLWPREV
jgi:hypothetical protein